jgi:hypothetical protein
VKSRITKVEARAFRMRWEKEVRMTTERGILQALEGLPLPALE